MSWRNRVLWTEGMFLRPQHFQQADRWTERIDGLTLRAARPLAFGFTTLEIDEGLLRTGAFALARAAGVLPDGTIFDAPGSDDHPQPIEIPSDMRDAVIHLGLPVRRDGAVEATLQPDRERSLRLIGHELEAADAVAGSAALAPITVGKLGLRLLTDREELDGYVTLPVAKVTERRIDGALTLDSGFLPCALSLEASGRLQGVLSEMRGLLQHRGAAIAARFATPGGKSSAEFSDFLLLTVVNRNESVLRHLGSVPALHPETLYLALTALAGELSTFTETSCRPPQLPPYRQADQEESFAPLLDFLRDALSAVFEQTAIPIHLEPRPYNIRVGKISDRSLFTDCVFVLAAKSTLDAEKLRVNLPKRTTVGPVERIRDLVNLQLGGAPIRPLPTEPRQIPFRAGMVYFEVNAASEDWGLVERSGGVAVHVSGDVPDLTLELWAIRGRVR